ncbi:glycine zipper 2TM domain-containing protein [Nitratifractor sp.]
MKMKKKTIAWMAMILSVSAFGGSISWNETVQVTRSVPVYRDVTIRTPYQVCWKRCVPAVYRNGVEEPVAAIIGGVAGGVIGHQIGKGRGRDAATIGGAAVGALVGANLAESNRGSDCVVRRVCRTHYRVRKERRLIRYRNIAWYKGHKIVKWSKKPLKKIVLHLQVSY